MQPTAQHWWQGRRGEWYVVGQLILMALVFFGPRSFNALPDWPLLLRRIASVVGGLLMLAGAMLMIAGIFWLRRSLTPLPYPKAGGQLIQSGPYRIVRHPMYCGGLGLAYGWGLLAHGWLTVLYAIALHAFANIKANREERWLLSRYPDYADYQRHTPKLIPFICAKRTQPH